MDRNQLIIAIAIALFAAFVIGWLFAMLLNRLSPRGSAGVDDLDRVTRQLVRVEGERDRAVSRLERREAELTEQLAAQGLQLAGVQDDLREASHEINELRGHINSKTGGG